MTTPGFQRILDIFNIFSSDVDVYASSITGSQHDETKMGNALNSLNRFYNRIREELYNKKGLSREESKVCEAILADTRFKSILKGLRNIWEHGKLDEPVNYTNRNYEQSTIPTDTSATVAFLRFILKLPDDDEINVKADLISVRDSLKQKLTNIQ
jgi:hypothetical protein